MCKIATTQLRAGRLLLRVCLAIACAVGPYLTYAADWNVASGSSFVEFVVDQRGELVRGRFESFTAAVELDQTRPDDGRVSGTVVLASVDTGIEERDLMLLTQDWFDIPNWPEAHFESTRIEQSGNGMLRAHGQLFLKGRTRPVVLDFSFTNMDAASARLSGTVQLRRLEFGIGEGDWADTDWIADDVTVRVELSLTR